MKKSAVGEIRRLIAQFKEHLEIQHYARRSVGGYVDRLKPLVAFLDGEEGGDIRGVTRDVLHRYQVHVFEHRGKDGRPWGLLTQSHFLTAARVFFRYLVKRGTLMSDPSSVLELPKQRDPLPRGILTKGEARRLLNAPDLDTPQGLRDKAVLELFYATGIRCMELASLTPLDVDLSNQEVRVRCGKGGKERVVPMGGVAAGYVGEYVRGGRPHYLKRRDALGVTEEERDLLFMGETGKPLSSMVVSELVRKYAGKAGIGKRVTSHGLRHTCATHMLKGGASLRHIQEMLGHGSLETTQIYTHVTVTDLKREHRRTHPRERVVP